MEEVEAERTALRTKAAKMVHRLKGVAEKRQQRIDELEASTAAAQKKLASIQAHTGSAKTDTTFLMLKTPTAAMWRSQWRKMLAENSFTDSSLTPMDVPRLLKTSAAILGDRLHMAHNYVIEGDRGWTPQDRKRRWGLQWFPQLAECAYDYFVTKHGGDVVAAGRGKSFDTIEALAKGRVW